jgi:glutathione S-transferase
MNKLYYSTGACSLAAHILLEEIGTPYELEAVNLRAGEQKRPEFLALNPKGSTPVLVTDHGPLTENVAILTYLATTNPDAGLAPVGDAWASAQLTSFCAFLASSVHPNIGKLLFYPLGEAEKAAQREVTLTKLRLIEDHLMVGPWVMGEAYSLADPYLSVFERWARQGGLLDPAEFPGMNAHLDAVQARPSAQRVFDQEGIAEV